MKPENEDKGLPSTPNLIVSVLVHLLILLPYLYIIVIYFINYSLFSWHAICSSVGVGILILEGVFGISGEAYLGHRFSRVNRVTTHWIISTVAIILMFIGLIVIIVWKNIYGLGHFETIHGQLGLSVIVISSLVALFGIVANNPRWIYPRLRPVVVKVVHATGGIAVTMLFTATNINGIFIVHNFGETARGLICTGLVLATVLVLFKPIIAVIARMRVILQPPEPNNQSTLS